MLKLYDGGKAPAVPYYAVIILELYPKTKMAEIEYWVRVVLQILLVIFIYPLLFGIVAHFLLIGG